MEGVIQFKYLGRTMGKSDNESPEILRDIRRARKVWGRMGKVMLYMGADTHVSEMFYQMVFQVVLFFLS